MTRRIVLALTLMLLLFAAPASAHLEGKLTLSESKTDICQEGDACTNTFDASLEGGVGRMGGALKVEARNPDLWSRQGYVARFSTVVRVPPRTRKIALTSEWFLNGTATATGTGNAGCSVTQSAEGFNVVHPIFSVDGDPATLREPAVVVNRSFTFSEIFDDGPFPREMTLWSELSCGVEGKQAETTGLASLLDLNLTRGEPLHLHVIFE